MSKKVCIPRETYVSTYMSCPLSYPDQYSNAWCLQVPNSPTASVHSAAALAGVVQPLSLQAKVPSTEQRKAMMNDRKVLQSYRFEHAESSMESKRTATSLGEIEY